VTLQHESHRDGYLTADNEAEGFLAALAHTTMAERMLSDGKDLSLSNLLVTDLLAWQFSGRDEEIFASYVAENYDSSGDYWKLVKDDAGKWGWEDDKSADFDISDALEDEEFDRSLDNRYGRKILYLLTSSEIIDGKDTGIISAGRMSVSGILALEATLNMPRYYNQFLPEFAKETLEKMTYNREHTTTVYNGRSQPKTLWNIDGDNKIADQLLKQKDSSLEQIENLASDGCNFMVILGYAQMVTKSILDPAQIKTIWDTAIADKIMAVDGTVIERGVLATLALNKLGKSDIGLSFGDTVKGSSLIGYRIQVPYGTGSHFLLGDRAKLPIYNSGNTYNDIHTSDMAVWAYAK
jgi:hypothetical protein